MTQQDVTYGHTSESLLSQASKELERSSELQVPGFVVQREDEKRRRWIPSEDFEYLDRMSAQSPALAIIFDLDDVLFTWSPQTNTEIPSSLLLKITSSPTWSEYECGRLTQETCHSRIIEEFSIELSQIPKGFSQVCTALQPNDRLVAFIKDLTQSHTIPVYAMSNMASEEFSALSTQTDLSMFKQVFTSGEVGICMPDPNFYRFVLEEIKIAPEQVVFVDQKEDNVLAAKSLGIKAFVFAHSTIDKLQAMFDDPIAKGRRFLHRNAKNFDSLTDNGITVADNFAELLILEATQEPNLVNVTGDFTYARTWNFFPRDVPLFPGGYFPDDLDTTCLALTVFRPDAPEVIKTLLDFMLEYVNADGSIQVFYDKARDGNHPVISANILACFYVFGRGHQLPATLKHIEQFILDRRYLQGTRYYPSADVCLGYFTRLLNSAPKDKELQARLGPLLRERVRERVGESGSALDLAIRIIACSRVGVEWGNDRDTLLALQCQDGSWEWCCMYEYGRKSGASFGNVGVTTALAVKALAVTASAAGDESEAKL